MSIEGKIEQAKIFLQENNFKESIKLLKSLISINNNKCFYESIIFELGKVYMISKDYEKAIYFLKKIKEDKNLKNFATEMLYKIYKMLNRLDDQFKLLKHNLNYVLEFENLNNILNVFIKNKKFVIAFKVINYCRTNNYEKIDYNKILKELYKEISLHIQYLNKEHKHDETKKFFRTINKYIPKEEIKIKNILLNEYELAQGKVYLKSYPRILNLILTTKCNLKCIMCGKLEHNGLYDLSNKCINDLVNMMPYIEHLILRGGEVFLHKQILYILEQAKKNKVNVEIITNGLLLTEKIINILVDVLTEITFSIDSINKDLYEHIRVGAKFETLLNNLKKFYELNKEKNFKVNMRLTMVVMKSNYKEIENIISFAGKYGFKELYLLPVRGISVEKSESIFYYGFDKDIVEELKNKRDLFNQLAKKYNIKLYNTLPTIKTIDACDVNYTIDDEEKEDKIKLNLLEYISSDDLDKNINIDKIYCHAPWKQFFLKQNQDTYMPTCLCTNFISNIKFVHRKNKNFIKNEWNNDVMQTYRYMIVNKKQDKVCFKDCLIGASEQMKIL